MRAHVEAHDLVALLLAHQLRQRTEKSFVVSSVILTTAATKVEDETKLHEQAAALRAGAA